MEIIVGLGNPGKQYENTRHNMGFRVLDLLAEREGISLTRLKHRALVGEGRIAGKKVLLVKPQTYMNNSGESVGEIVRYYDVDPEHLLVVYDDMDMPAGTIRIRKKGGAGSHNGMKSILSHLQGEQNFPRVRVGIGGSRGEDWKDFVLNKVGKEEGDLLAKGVEQAADAISCMLREDMDMAMNRYNSRPEKKKESDRD